MNNRPVLFASFRPLERAENIRAIYEAYQGKKEHICTYDPDFVERVTSDRYDVMVTDDFPSVTPGKCVMIWHGIQGGKYIGLDQPGNPYYHKSDARKMSCIISGSIHMIPVWEKCTGVDAMHILPWGLPITDEYVGKQKGDGHSILAGKRSYLFVPTFRDAGETEFPDIDWHYIDSQLTDDEMFVIKAHPWSVYQRSVDQITKSCCISGCRHIIAVSGAEPSAPYLYDADVVITDYSSIMFDAYLLNKPVVLFEKNPGYVETRGMYLKYPDQYCSWCARTEKDLMTYIRSAYETGLGPIEKRCLDTVAEACDGYACERICKMLDKMTR